MTSVVRFLNRGTRIPPKAGSYGSINPKRAHPPSRHFSGICQVLCSYDGVLVIKRGGGILSLKNFVLFAITITSIKVTSIAHKKDRNTSLLTKDLVAQNFEFTFCFVPRVGYVNTFSWPHRWAFPAFRRKNDKCPTNAGGMGTLGID